MSEHSSSDQLRSGRDRAWSSLRCPECHDALRIKSGAAHCARAGHSFPFVDGVLRFVQNDSFYEETFRNSIRHRPGANRTKDWIFFTLMQSGVFGHLRKVLRPDSVVVDLGCASGVRWLGDHHTIGVDLSFSSVRATSAFYEVAAQASANRLPLATCSVDVVYSSYFFEHLSAEGKKSSLAELARVMRPGGTFVLLFDTLSDGIFGRFARRDPAAFHRGFVAKDGHIGLAPLSRTLAQLRSEGFCIERVAKFGTTPLQYLSSYCWLDAAYGDSVRWVRWMGRAARAVSASRLRLPVELCTTSFDMAINRFVADDAATRAVVVARRERIANAGREHAHGEVNTTKSLGQ